MLVVNDGGEVSLSPPESITTANFSSCMWKVSSEASETGEPTHFQISHSNRILAADMASGEDAAGIRLVDVPAEGGKQVLSPASLSRWWNMSFLESNRKSSISFSGQFIAALTRTSKLEMELLDIRSVPGDVFETWRPPFRPSQPFSCLAITSIGSNVLGFGALLHDPTMLQFGSLTKPAPAWTTLQIDKPSTSPPAAFQSVSCNMRDIFALDVHGRLYFAALNPQGPSSWQKLAPTTQNPKNLPIFPPRPGLLRAYQPGFAIASVASYSHVGVIILADILGYTWLNNPRAGSPWVRVVDPDGAKGPVFMRVVARASNLAFGVSNESHLYVCSAPDADTPRWAQWCRLRFEVDGMPDSELMETIVVLSASDLGLVVGMDSGELYLADLDLFDFERVSETTLVFRAMQRPEDDLLLTPDPVPVLGVLAWILVASVAVAVVAIVIGSLSDPSAEPPISLPEEPPAPQTKKRVRSAHLDASSNPY